MRYRGWMWTEALELIDRAERLHRQFFRRVLSTAGPSWEPPIDWFEDSDGSATILIALPGVAPDQLRIEVEGNAVRVTGNRPWPRELGRTAVRRLEIPHGRFERHIELPGGLYSLQQHELRHGCLMLQLRRH
jgi:HSP20 family protein